jgi:hypothetical protein
VVDSANACAGLISIFLPEALTLTPFERGGKILMHFSAVFPLIHSEKMRVIFARVGYFAVPMGGMVKRTNGGVLSSGPPLGGICRAQERKRIKRNVVFFNIDHVRY